MIIHGIHIAGWFLIVLFIIALLVRTFRSREKQRSLSLRNIRDIFNHTFIAIAVIISLAVLYYSGKDLPFNKTPRIYKKVIEYIDSRKLNSSRKIRKAVSYCGIGNVYRCFCEVEDLIQKYPKQKELIEIRDIIKKEIKTQNDHERFLD